MRIPFKTLKKYKYLYFVLSSFILSVFVVFWIELFVNEVSDLTIKHLIHNFFYYWGFMYPVSFVAYEAAKRSNKKREEKNDCNS